jgi:gliding motility-associated-like protein
VTNLGPGCTSKDSVQIAIYPGARADAGHDTTLCFGQSAQLGVPHLPFDEAQYLWRPTIYLSDAFASDPTFINPNLQTEQTLTYVLKKLDMASQCPGYDTVQITLRPRAEAGFAGPDLELCSGDTAQIGAGIVGIPEIFYHWEPGRWLDDSIRSQTVIRPILRDDASGQTFVYRLIRTEAFFPACPAEDTVLVTVHSKYDKRPDGTYICIDLPPLVVPNVITPNGDGQNDGFTISGLEFYPKSTLHIYNRWGKMVFQQSPYENQWQGDRPGLYFYRLEIPATGQTYKGWVEVVK